MVLIILRANSQNVNQTDARPAQHPQKSNQELRETRRNP
jgi:hypothetical protein